MSKQPGNNGQESDPWRQPNRGGDGRIYEQGPPDLSDLWSRLTKRVKRFSGGDTGNGRAGGGSGSGSEGNLKWPGLILGAAVAAWAASGFYTIKEAERGVVTRFGRLSHNVLPGLNWRANFIERVTPVNIELVRELSTAGLMLTRDENVVQVEMNVQYKVIDPAKYLFSVTNANDSLRQATDSALRYVVGHTTMDEVLTRGRAKVRQDTWQLIDSIVAPYHMGLQVVDVNFQLARPPEEVKAAFDDAIAAQEDQQRFIREAEAYAREREPRARGEAKRLEEQALAYKEGAILRARGEVAHFSQLLPQYLQAPKITRERLYLEAMERLLGKTRKVLVDSAPGSHVMVLPLEQLLRGKKGVQPAAATKPPMATTADQAVNGEASATISTPLNNTTTRRGRFSQ